MITVTLTAQRTAQAKVTQTDRIQNAPLLEFGELEAFGLTVESDLTTAGASTVVRTIELSGNAQFELNFPTPAAKESMMSQILLARLQLLALQDNITQQVSIGPE